MLNFYKKQSGSIMPVTALALASIMGMAGLVVDTNQLYSSKSRLQNLVDAAALGSAKVLSDTQNQFRASIAARLIISNNLAQPEYRTISDLGINAQSFLIQYSATRNPFVAGPASRRYVRVSLERGNFSINTLFMGIFGVDTLGLSSSAVAGPSPALGQVCNIIPTIICGNPNIAPSSTGMFGYTFYNPVTLALGNVKNNNLGPGNYQLLDLSEHGNNNGLRESLAGGSTACIAAGETVETRPGVNRGPVAQGINTRFGVYTGPVSAEYHPPDLVTDAGAPNYPDTYTEYLFDYRTRQYDEAIAGLVERRVVTVAFGNCNATVNGRGNVPVLGFGCVFLTAPAQNNGALQTVQLSGELVRDCRSSGIPGPSAIAGQGGSYTIQLYGDPDRWDS